MKISTLSTLAIFIIGLPQFLFAQNFLPEERALILRGDTMQGMRIIQSTVAAENEILTRPSSNINTREPLLPLLLKRMYIAMTDTTNPGIGIAAPQVGINRKVIWVKRYDKADAPFEYYINPLINWSSNLMRKGSEGCLSIPDARGDVLRHYAIAIQYQDSLGGTHEEIIEGFTAVIFQHEIDHLKGILFPQRMREQAQTKYETVATTTELFFRELPLRP
jgi:peptide deformylase